mgnify:CR=1 FL=1
MRLTDLHHDLTALRQNLADELVAISRLEGQTLSLTDERTREELRRLADEKKAHAATLLRQIMRLDPKFGERVTAE